MAQLIDDDPRIIEFDVRTDEMLVNMGPQHPSTHGVLRLVLRTDGEVVSEVEPHIGYLHRCAEKIGENLTHRQWIPYTDRMDYLAAMNMNLGWALAVEKLMKYEVSEKARHLRVLICELGRIASHLVGMGAYGLDLGTFSPFLYAFREREKILDLFEEDDPGEIGWEGSTERVCRFFDLFDGEAFHVVGPGEQLEVRRARSEFLGPPLARGDRRDEEVRDQLEPFVQALVDPVSGAAEPHDHPGVPDGTRRPRCTGVVEVQPVHQDVHALGDAADHLIGAVIDGAADSGYPRRTVAGGELLECQQDPDPGEEDADHSVVTFGELREP